MTFTHEIAQRIHESSKTHEQAVERLADDLGIPFDDAAEILYDIYEDEEYQELAGL